MLFRLSPPRRKGLWELACAFGLFCTAYAAGLNDTGITERNSAAETDRLKAGGFNLVMEINMV